MNPPKLPNSFRHKFRYPSIQKETPQFLPLYNLIQSQNHDEEDFLERNFNPKDPILNNLPKQAPPFKMRAQIGKGKLFSFKRRNLHLEGNFTNRTFEEKSDEDDNNSIIKRKNTSFCEIMKKINKDLSKSLLYDQEFSQKRFLRRSNISVLFDKQRHDSDIQIKKLLSELFQDQKGPLKFHDEIKDRFEKIRNRREIEKSFSLLSQKPNIRSYELMELLYNRRLLCSACSQSEKGDFNELGSKNISSVQRDNNDSIKVSEDKSPSSVLQTENKSPTSILKSRNGNNYPIIESFSKSESNNKDPSSILHSNNKSPFSIKSSQNKTSYLEETSYLTQDFPFKKSLKPEIWDYFFTMRMQRVDSQKIRLFLKIEGKEVAFVMGEGSDNYLRFNRKKEEFQFYGNDQHDKGLLLDIERYY